MAMSLGDAVLYLRSDGTQLDKGVRKSLERVRDGLNKASKWFLVFGGAVTAALAGTVKAWANMGDEVQKMSLRTGLTTELLSELRHAAELSGTSLTGLEVGIRRMSQSVNDAKLGLGEAVRAFDQLGLNVEELEGMSPDETFIHIAEAVAQVEDPMERAAIATDVFGRSGTMLLPMLAQGREGLNAMRQEARDLGLVFDLEAANKAAAFNDALTKLKNAFAGVIIEMGPLIADLVTDLIPALVKTVAAMRDWMESNPGLTRAIVRVVGVLGPLALALGVVLKVVSMVLLPFAKLYKLFGSAAGAAGKMSGASAALGGALATVKGTVVAAGTAIASLSATVVGAAAAVAGLVAWIGKYIQYVAQARSSAKQAAAAEDALADAYERQGIAVDRAAMKQADFNDRLAVLTEQRRESQDKAVMAALRRYASEEEAQEAFIRASRLNQNAWIDAETAARLALMQLSNEMYVKLLRANEEQTQTLLDQLGIMDRAVASYPDSWARATAAAVNVHGQGMARIVEQARAASAALAGGGAPRMPGGGGGPGGGPLPGGPMPPTQNQATINYNVTMPRGSDVEGFSQALYRHTKRQMLLQGVRVFG